MFDELIDGYQNQLELFEGVAFQQFAELDAATFEELKDFGSHGADPAATAPVVELVEACFSSLDEQAFARLNLTRRL